MRASAGAITLLTAAVIVAAAGGCSQKANDLDQLNAFLQKHRSPVSGIEYRVLPPDVIAISSRYVREINNIRQQVRPDGKINLPLVGEVFVAGRTPKQIAMSIATLVRDYYNRVDVTVTVVEYKSQKIYVFGQVLRPGPQPWTGADTLLDLLATVQPTLLAWPEKIKVVRAKPPSRGGYMPEISEDDQGEETSKFKAEELTVNLFAMIKTGDMSRNIMLRPDDVVYVPPNPFAGVGLAIQQLLFPIRPVVDVARAPGDIREAKEDME